MDICPVEAFTGREFIPGEPREARYDAAACDNYFKAMRAERPWAVCGLCIWACPWGRKEK